MKGCFCRTIPRDAWGSICLRPLRRECLLTREITAVGPALPRESTPTIHRARENGQRDATVAGNSVSYSLASPSNSCFTVADRAMPLLAFSR